MVACPSQEHKPNCHLVKLGSFTLLLLQIVQPIIKPVIKPVLSHSLPQSRIIAEG